MKKELTLVEELIKVGNKKAKLAKKGRDHVNLELRAAREIVNLEMNYAEINTKLAIARDDRSYYKDRYGEYTKKYYSLLNTNAICFALLLVALLLVGFFGTAFFVG